MFFYSKGGLLDDKNVILLQSKKLHFFKGVYPWSWSEITNIFPAYVFVKETLVLSFGDVVFLKKEAF